MKRIFILVLMVAFGLILASCGGNSNSTPESNNDDNKVTTSPITNNTGVVEHYICPDGHVGSGGSGAGTCSQCGATLVHNQAFHKNDPPPAAPSTPQVNALSPVLTTPSAPGTVVPPNPNQAITATPPKNEPPQNAAGVWHYTCPSGCAGGGGSATACASCGTTLVHNTAYHN